MPPGNQNAIHAHGPGRFPVVQCISHQNDLASGANMVFHPGLSPADLAISVVIVQPHYLSEDSIEPEMCNHFLQAPLLIGREQGLLQSGSTNGFEHFHSTRLQAALAATLLVYA